ncbi:hypothetical protein TNCV_3037611 [Trichonephila clavipes]|nr:hypothetical protein TNCV_3037611 [Trichonephila clavipes]
MLASVLWYLRYWRHTHTQTKISSLGYSDTLQDAATGWVSDDSASEVSVLLKQQIVKQQIIFPVPVLIEYYEEFRIPAFIEDSCCRHNGNPG